MSDLSARRAAVIALLCISLIFSGNQRVRALDQPQSGANDRSVNPLAQVDPASLKGFRDRPLFSPTRTRPEDPPQPQEDQPDPPTVPDILDIRILGIVVAPDRRTAFVLELGNNHQHVLHVGDEISGWSVTSIEPDSGLTMTKGDMRHVFTVFKK